MQSARPNPLAGADHALLATCSKQPAINAGLRSLDRNGANGFGVEIGGADPADDSVAIALMSHRFEAGEQQGDADALAARLWIDAGWTEEVPACRVVAGKAKQALVLDGNEAGYGLPREGDIGLA